MMRYMLYRQFSSHVVVRYVRGRQWATETKIPRRIRRGKSFHGRKQIGHDH